MHSPASHIKKDNAAGASDLPSYGASVRKQDLDSFR